MADDFGKAFLKANANKEFICAQFIDVLRDLIRAIAVRDDPSAPIWRATEHWKFITDLPSHCEERISTHEMFSTAVNALREAGEKDEIDGALLIAARLGMSLYVESSCRDNAARGRTSKRRDRFLTAIRKIEARRMA
jgi:hypothetical protein